MHPLWDLTYSLFSTIRGLLVHILELAAKVGVATRDVIDRQEVSYIKPHGGY